MSVQSGPQSSYNSLAANQMPDNDKLLYLIKPYQTVMFQKLYFSKGVGSEQVINENGKFSVFEDEYVPHQTTITNITGGATSEDNITVGDATWIQEGDILLIEDTEELVRVDSIASSQIDITSLDGGNITACTTGYLKKVGSYVHEYSGVRTSVSTQEVEYYNYLTIFSESVSQTGRRQAGKKFTNGKSFRDELKKKVEEMKLMFERNFKFSTEKGTGTATGSDGNTYRVSWGEGFLARVSTNRQGYTTLNEAAFDSYFGDVFAKGNKVKDHYSGTNQSVAINKIVKDKYAIDPKPITTSYGVDLSKYTLPMGTLNLYWDQQMDGKFVDFGFTVDWEVIKMRYMANDEKGSRKFRIEENVETPGTDGKVTKLLADLAIQIPNEELHGILHKS